MASTYTRDDPDELELPAEAPSLEISRETQPDSKAEKGTRPGNIIAKSDFLEFTDDSRLVRGLNTDKN
jgi:hypothetical protein